MLGLTEDDSDLFLIVFFLISLMLFAIARYWKKKDTYLTKIYYPSALIEGILILLFTIYSLIRLILIKIN
jgi:hypothetical protein